MKDHGSDKNDEKHEINVKYKDQPAHKKLFKITIIMTNEICGISLSLGNKNGLDIDDERQKTR